MNNISPTSAPIDLPDQHNNIQLDNFDANPTGQLNKQILSYKKQISSLQKTYQNLESQFSKTKEDNQKLRQTLDKISKENKKLKTQIVDMAKKTASPDACIVAASPMSDQTSDDESCDIQLQKAQSRISELEAANQKLQKQKSKFNKKWQQQQQVIEELKTEIINLKAEKSKLVVSNQSNLDEVNALQVELENRNLARNETETTISSLNNAKKVFSMSLKALQDQLENQQKEIARYSDERENYNIVIRKLYLLLTITSAKCQDVLQEMEAIKKSQGKPLVFHDLTDISNLVIPFKGEFGKKCINLLKLEQYEPFQRVQLIINEIHKELLQLDDRAQMSEEQLKQFMESQASASHKNDLLGALLKGLKTLADTEKQFDQSAYCETDPAFLSFMSAHCSDFIDVSTNSKDKYFSQDLFLSTSLENRKKAIEQLKATDQIALSLVNSLFLFNTRLVEQNRKMVSNMINKKELNKLAHQVGAKHYSEIPAKLEAILKQLQDLKKFKQKNLNPKQTNLVTTSDNSQLNSTISQLQEELDGLKEENKSLKFELQIASNEAACRKAGPNDEIISRLKAENERLLNEIEKLKEQISYKDSEIEQLQDKINENEQTIVDLSNMIQQYSIEKGNYESRIRDYQRMISASEAKFQALQKKMKKKIKSMKIQHQDEKNKMNESYEQVKTMYEQSIESMNRKMDQMRELSKQMADAQAKSEKRNRELDELNLQLQTQSQNLSSQVAILSEQARTEKQKAEERATAKMISMENQLQDEFGILKAKILEQDHKLRSAFISAIGSKYGISDPNFSIENFEQLLEKVQNDLKKLQMFQCNGTSYNLVTQC